jgi:hypothetical protein
MALIYKILSKHISGIRKIVAYNRYRDVQLIVECDDSGTNAEIDTLLLLETNVHYKVHMTDNADRHLRDSEIYKFINVYP